MKLNTFGKVIENVDLTNYNTYKIKTKAKYLVKPNDKDSLKDLIAYLKGNNLKYLILGNGSNIILPDTTFEGVIIKLDNLNKIEINERFVYVESGVMLNKLALHTIDNNLKGLEWATGIPGSIGGAIIGNAGAYKSAIFDYIEEVYVLDNDEFKTLKVSDINHSYRYTSLKDNKNIIVLGCLLSLNYGTKEASMELVNDRLQRRLSSQPLEYPSAGSVFRNPSEDMPSGKLIETVGLKGTNKGDAYISSKHANFIVNKGHAKSCDIISLIDIIKDKVKKEYKIDLVLEQEIIKW